LLVERQFGVTPELPRPRLDQEAPASLKHEPPTLVANELQHPRTPDRFIGRGDELALA
jgi:hypothetical protein